MNIKANLNLSTNKKLIIILLLAIGIRLLLILINSHNPTFSFEQEGYVFYINSLKSGFINNINFGAYNERLFPGYLLLILPFTYLLNQIIAIGIVLNLIIFALSFYLIWKIFKNIFINALFAFFPPVWLMQSSKASSEPLTIFLLLSSFYLFLKKNYISTGIIIGLAFNVRIIAGCFLLAVCVILFFEKKYKEFSRVIVGFILTASLLIIYNFFVFGKDDLLIQFQNLDQNYGVVRIGLVQIFYDLYRTLDWGQYRIFISGSIYLIINFFALFILFKFRQKDRIIKLCLYWILFSLIFVFSLSPFTLIENFSRYMLPALPAVCLAIYLVFDNYIKLLLLPKKPKFTSNKKRMKAH